MTWKALNRHSKRVMNSLSRTTAEDSLAGLMQGLLTVSAMPCGRDLFPVDLIVPYNPARHLKHMEIPAS